MKMRLFSSCVKVKFPAVGILQLELLGRRHNPSFRTYDPEVVDDALSNGLYLQ